MGVSYKLLAHLLVLGLYIYSFPVFAHPGNTDSSGCHTCRTNCPSWGLSYGEYHCHTPKYYTPVYIPPTPTPTPIDMKATLQHTLDTTICKYSINFSWDKPYLYDRYSVSAVKTSSKSCLDPGPLADTTSTQWTFRGLTSGNYLINIKPGNRYGWEYYQHCWQYSLPKIQPNLELKKVVEGDKQYIQYKATCVKSVSGNKGLGQLNATEDKILVDSSEEKTYEITATSIDGEVVNKIITVGPITPTPLIVNTSNATSSGTKTSEGIGTAVAMLTGIGGFIYIFQRAINQKWPFHGHA